MNLFPLDIVWASVSNLQTSSRLPIGTIWKILAKKSWNLNFPWVLLFPCIQNDIVTGCHLNLHLVIKRTPPYLPISFWSPTLFFPLRCFDRSGLKEWRRVGVTGRFANFRRNLCPINCPHVSGIQATVIGSSCYRVAAVTHNCGGKSEVDELVPRTVVLVIHVLLS